MKFEMTETQIDEALKASRKPEEGSNSFDLLAELEKRIRAVGEDASLLEEESRFSVTIPIPRLTPSEAWGDPDSQSRKEVERAFSVVTGGKDIRQRIQSINKFLSPESARKKRSPSVILNMMMIVEALQATLNDYNESAAGFVFEGFMAALTGGKQIAGKVAGTLPIEDFVAFSEFGADQPVSLKLLSGKTPVKGSFTNLVDFLLVRGAPAIKYLVAYKLTSGKGSVEKINIIVFDITIDNFIDFMEGVGGGSSLINNTSVGKHGNKKKYLERYGTSDSSQLARLAFKEFSERGKESLPEIAPLITDFSGYQRAGLLHNFIKSGELPTERSPEEEEAELARRSATRVKDYERTKKYGEPQDSLTETTHQHLDNKQLTLNEAFHYLEKRVLLSEAAGESQWAASLPQLENLSATINLESYGELDLSQSNIDQLVEIYSEILGDEIKTLLSKTKDLTENIGKYYSEKRRSKAQAAGQAASEEAEGIKQVLEGDPRYQSEN
tara:strand:- start:199 stop:1692 length:1494 start_codon:yes stop_codon:yes gene_type:complete